MNRTIVTLAAAALAAAVAVAPAAAQVRTAPGYAYQTPGFGLFYGPRAYYAPNAYYAPYGGYAYRRYEPGYGPYGLHTGGAFAIGADN